MLLTKQAFRRNMRTVLIVTISVVALIAVGYYPYFAWVRHEHFYRGLPTSHWAATIKRWSQDDSHKSPTIVQLDAVLKYLGLAGPPAVLSGDNTAVPVLLDLVVNE